jgi:hypothetical protein
MTNQPTGIHETLNDGINEVKNVTALPDATEGRLNFSGISSWEEYIVDSLN